jgi:predicted RNA-binding Zn-ribbon protein involved in translation (DUF1610 family)
MEESVRDRCVYCNHEAKDNRIHVYGYECPGCKESRLGRERRSAGHAVSR